MRTYRNYTDADILRAVRESKSIAGVLRALGLKSAGGNYANMKRNLQRLNADTFHFTGKAWNRSERLKDWSDYTRAANLKPHLLKERGSACEGCGNDVWRQQPIMLEIHHIDGDRTNNRLGNLQLLCPNCFSQTTSWRSSRR